MKRYAIAYGSFIIVMLLLDAGWLTVMGKVLYKPRLGDMLLASPNLGAAIVFYLIYAAGVTVLVTHPALQAQSMTSALLSGAIFGVVAYATYDLTNQATLRNWSTVITVVDMIWGAVLTSAGATVSYLVTTRWG